MNELNKISILAFNKGIGIKGIKGIGIKGIVVWVPLLWINHNFVHTYSHGRQFI